MSFQLPCVPCASTPPCCDSITVVVDGGGSGTGVTIQSEITPEGNVVASPGAICRFSDGVAYEIWYKESGTLTPNGWVMWFKFS